MRIIVSSLNSYRTLLEVLDNDPVEFGVRKRGIEFIMHKTDKRICVGGESNEFCSGNYGFSKEKWIKVKDFVKSIPEQPIVIKFNDESIEITAVVVF
jgi:hypothetical protein